MTRLARRIAMMAAFAVLLTSGVVYFARRHRQYDEQFSVAKTITLVRSVEQRHMASLHPDYWVHATAKVMKIRHESYTAWCRARSTAANHKTIRFAAVWFAAQGACRHRETCFALARAPAHTEKSGPTPDPARQHFANAQAPMPTLGGPAKSKSITLTPDACR